MPLLVLLMFLPFLLPNSAPVNCPKVGNLAVKVTVLVRLTLLLSDVVLVALA